MQVCARQPAADHRKAIHHASATNGSCFTRETWQREMRFFSLEGASPAGEHRSHPTHARPSTMVRARGRHAGHLRATSPQPASASDNASVTVAARRGLVLSSARHAGENSSMESPKAQPPEPLRQKDRVRSKSLESGTGARRRRIHRRGTPSSAVTSHTYMSADATRSRENLSGKRTERACSVTNRTRPFLVHPDGAPSR